jgi:alpha-tubulin suppressor-like RCC1 family protein
VAVAAGGAHYIALRDDGTVICWGDNTYGQAIPPPGLSNVVAISAGELYSTALLANGTVAAWGTGIAGVTNLPIGLTNVDAVAAGYFHTVALVGTGPPVSRALIKNPQLSTAGFSVSISSQSGRVYGLEYKDALDQAAWTRLPLAAGTGKTLALRDPAAGAGQRFYRIRRW